MHAEKLISAYIFFLLKIKPNIIITKRITFNVTRNRNTLLCVCGTSLFCTLRIVLSRDWHVSNDWCNPSEFQQKFQPEVNFTGITVINWTRHFWLTIDLITCKLCGILWYSILWLGILWLARYIEETGGQYIIIIISQSFKSYIGISQTKENLHFRANFTIFNRILVSYCLHLLRITLLHALDCLFIFCRVYTVTVVTRIKPAINFTRFNLPTESMTFFIVKPHCYLNLIAFQSSLLCKPHCYANLIAMQTSLLCKTSLLFKPHCYAKPHCHSNHIVMQNLIVIQTSLP